MDHPLKLLSHNVEKLENHSLLFFIQPCPAVQQLRLRFGQLYRRFSFCKELG